MKLFLRSFGGVGDPGVDFNGVQWEGRGSGGRAGEISGVVGRRMVACTIFEDEYREKAKIGRRVREDGKEWLGASTTKCQVHTMVRTWWNAMSNGDYYSSVRDVSYDGNHLGR